MMKRNLRKRAVVLGLMLAMTVSMMTGCGTDSGSEGKVSSGEVKSDDKGFYSYEGYVIKSEYPMDEKSLERAADRFQNVYQLYLKDTKCESYFAIVPDKNTYAAEAGQDVLDYEALKDKMKSGTSDFLEYIEISDLLMLPDYYKTDAHWRQEKLYPVAQRLMKAMGGELTADYDEIVASETFTGAYGHQSDLEMEPEELIYLDNEVLEGCKVTDYETGKVISVYDTEKAGSEEGDGYDLFLYGSKSLLTIENPEAATDKELVIFRDSFGSSIAPFFEEYYSKVTLIDIRYLASEMVGRFVDFDDQDILFLYSTPVLNNSVTLK